MTFTDHQYSVYLQISFFHSPCHIYPVSITMIWGLPIFQEAWLFR